MSDQERMSLDLAIFSLQSDLARLEANRDKLNESDRAELRIVMARLNSILSARRAAA